MRHGQVGGSESLFKLGVKLGIIVLLFAGAMLAITTALSTRGRAAAWDEAVTHPAPPTTAPATR